MKYWLSGFCVGLGIGALEVGGCNMVPAHPIAFWITFPAAMLAWPVIDFCRTMAVKKTTSASKLPKLPPASLTKR